MAENPPGQTSLGRSVRSLLTTPRLQVMLFLLLPVLIFVSVRPFLVQTDPDYGWHVRTGQYIFETGSLPHSDIYSFTAVGQPWVTHEWLSELLFYLVARLGGYRLLVVAFALITGLTWTLVYTTCRRWGVGELGAILLMAWSFGMSAGSINVRPQGVTTLLLAACALVLTLYRQGKAKPLYLLPPLFALWVNLHGGYAIGLALVGLAVAGQALETWLRRPVAPLRPLLIVAVLCVLATLLNPHGLTALTYPFSYAGAGNASMMYLNEWQSPDFHLTYYLIFAASLILAMLIGFTHRPLGVTDTLWIVMLTFLALRSGRHIALYAIVVIPLLGARLQAVAPVLQRTLDTWRSRRILALTWPVVLVTVLILGNDAAKSQTLQFGREPSATTYPAGALQYLREHNLSGNLFNLYEWGGYLVYHLYPQRSVFIDGRPDVYGDAFVDKYVQVTYLKPTWRAVLDQYNIDLVLMDKFSPLAVVLGGAPDWQEVYSGAIESLFVRRKQ